MRVRNIRWAPLPTSTNNTLHVLIVELDGETYRVHYIGRINDKGVEFYFAFHMEGGHEAFARLQEIFKLWKQQNSSS